MQNFRIGRAAARPVIPGARREKGLCAQLSGAAAEEAVARVYDDRGADLLEARWRGEGGEIDLIFDEGGVIVFCEVKKARSIDEAITRLRPRQAARIHAAATEYFALLPLGQLSEVRFDLAAVDGRGQVQILEGAFSHF